MIPYELGLRRGHGARSRSGPVCDDVLDSLHLVAWSVASCIAQCAEPWSCDMHLHFPLSNLRAAGPSCRLSLANSLVHAWSADALYPPATTILLGDVTLGGDVLPVASLQEKVDAAAAAEMRRIVVPRSTRASCPGAIEIGSVRDLIAAS